MGGQTVGGRLLPLLEQTYPQPAPDPFVQLLEHSWCVRQPEVADPPPKVGVEAFKTLFQADTPATRRELTHPFLEPLQALGCDADPRLVFPGKGKPQELSPPGPVDGALLQVNPELQPPFHKSPDAVHHVQASPLAPDVDVAVVRVTGKPVPAPLQFLVQVVQDDVGQKRG